MSMRDVEKFVWREAKRVFNNPKLRLKDIQEWTTGKPKIIEGEVVAEVNTLDMHFSVAIKAEHDKRVKRKVNKL